MAKEGKPEQFPVRIMTVGELSEYLRVHPSTIYKLLRTGDLPGFKVGSDWRFNTEMIDRWCIEHSARKTDLSQN
jgi:excisionase family DNA binding protein